MEDKLYLWMEQYLNDELSSEEIKNFEIKLKEDLDFRKEFELFKEINNTYKNRIGNKEKVDALKETLTQLNKKYIKSKSNNKNIQKVININRYSKYLVAAGLVILAGFFFLKNGKPTYLDYNDFEQIELTVRSNENNVHLKKAQEAFNVKNYSEAEKELEILINEDKTKVSLQLYLAICLLEQNKFKKAEKILKSIKDGNSVYKTKATWYLALSKLKRQDYKACKKYLKMIPEDAPEYEDVKELLKKL
jgi:tetratricopeptide (TPR) repeat protein